MLIRGYSQLSFNENLTPPKRGLIRAYPCHSSVISPWLSLTGTLRPVSTGTSVGSVHGARVRYSLRTNVTPLLQMPTPKFGHDAGDQLQGRDPRRGGVLRILSGGNDWMGAIHYHESSDCFEYPKNPYLNQPKKLLRSSLSLEIQLSNPPPPPLGSVPCIWRLKWARQSFSHESNQMHKCL